jgi:hypothetical protein
LDAIKIANVDDQLFRCMFCLEQYVASGYPKMNDKIIEQLWSTTKSKYGFMKQGNDVSDTALVDDLAFEIENRHYHLNHLLKTLKQITNWDTVASAFIVSFTAHGLLYRLSKISEQMDTIMDDKSELLKEYKNVITLPDSSVGTFYISICEQLIIEIADAEYRAIFSTLCQKQKQWASNKNERD